MKTRQIGQDMAVSVRMSKTEWETTKIEGDDKFKDRNVGYMQVVPGKIFFDTSSPFYKEMATLDKENKEKSDDQVIKDQTVAEEIKLKKVQ